MRVSCNSAGSDRALILRSYNDAGFFIKKNNFNCFNDGLLLIKKKKKKKKKDSNLDIETLPKDIKTSLTDNEYIVYIDILTTNNYEYGATFVVSMMNSAFEWYIECL